MPKAEPYTLPFTVLIDSNESQPFTFHGIKGDSDIGYRPLVVPTKFRSLGKFPNSLADYTIDGFHGRINIERKSLDDLCATVLGWETDYERARHTVGRRDRFEKELENLSEIECGLVVVEASFGECLNQVPEWGTKAREANRKSLSRSIIAYQQDYSVQWVFCESRRMAEVITLRHLQRFWRKHKGEV